MLALHYQALERCCMAVAGGMICIELPVIGEVHGLYLALQQPLR
jgi:hypothetical protein